MTPGNNIDSEIVPSGAPTSRTEDVRSPGGILPSVAADEQRKKARQSRMDRVSNDETRYTPDEEGDIIIDGEILSEEEIVEPSNPQERPTTKENSRTRGEPEIWSFTTDQPEQETGNFQPTWLITSQENFTKLPQDLSFGKTVRALHVAEAMGVEAGPEDLRKIFLSLHVTAEEENIEEALLKSTLQKISDRIQNLKQNSGELDNLTEAVRIGTSAAMGGETEIPSDPEKQRHLARSLLNRIEQNELDTFNPINAQATIKLDNMLNNPEVDSLVKKEINARLRLQDCNALVKTALTGKTEEIVAKLRGGANTLRMLTPNDFELFFREGLEDLKITHAFQVLEEAAIDGIRLHSRAKPTKFFGKNSQPDAEALRNEILQRIGGNENEAKKSLQLAERLAKATLEDKVWRTPPGFDPVAQAIYFKQFRTTLNIDTGPLFTQKVIEGFGTSFIRQAKDIENNPIHAPGLYQDALTTWITAINHTDDPTYLTLMGDSQAMLLSKQRLQEGAGHNDVQLNFNEIGFTNLPVYSYTAYLASYVPSMLTVKDLLLKSDWSPGSSGDFSTDKVTGMIAPFDAMDTFGNLMLNEMFILGAIDEALKHPELGWGQLEIKEAGRQFIAALGVNNKGKPTRFILKWQWKWIKDRLKVGGRSFLNDFKLALRGATKLRK